MHECTGRSGEEREDRVNEPRRGVVSDLGARVHPHLAIYTTGNMVSRASHTTASSVLGNPVGSLTHPWLVEKTRATIAKEEDLASHGATGRFTSFFLRLLLEPGCSFRRISPQWDRP